MSGRFTQIPTFDQQISERGATSRVWYAFLNNLFIGNPPSSEVAVTPSGSPFSYTAPRKGFLIVNGGTVALVQWARTQGTNYTTGQTSGVFPLSAGDILVITYSVAPTLTFVSQ